MLETRGLFEGLFAANQPSFVRSTMGEGEVLAQEGIALEHAASRPAVTAIRRASAHERVAELDTEAAATTGLELAEGALSIGGSIRDWGRAFLDHTPPLSTVIRSPPVPGVGMAFAIYDEIKACFP